MSAAEDTKKGGDPVANGTATGYDADDGIFKGTKKRTGTSGPAAPPLGPSDVQAAIAELKTATMAQIEHATARTWGARALASYAMAGRTASVTARLDRFCDGDAFRQEALEHAAMAGDGRALLAGLQTQLDHARSLAQKSIHGALVAAPSAARG